MSEVINLKQARKQRNRDNKKKDSAVKRAQFGARKSERDVVEFTRTKLDKKLDDHKLDKPDSETE
ncbi:MAG: DUF4169 family protein [Hyphomicrobiales bacterium]